MRGGADDRSRGESGSGAERRGGDPGGWHLVARQPAWRGASIGAVLSVAAAGLLAGWFWQSGFGRVVDLGVGAAAGLVLAILGSAAAGLVLMLVRTGPIPRPFAAALAGSVVGLFVLNDLPYIGLDFPGEILRWWGPTYVAVQALAAGSLWHLFAGRFGGEGSPAYLAGGTLLTVAVALNVAGVWWLLSPGPGPVEEIAPAPVTKRAPSQLDVGSPASVGAYGVEALTYGSGENPRRPEFGEDADLVTPRVDGREVIPAWSGFTARVRERLWGFGPERFPLNGRVWYPDADGNFPLVLMVHGNHSMLDYSDGGYEYLGRLLASRGYVVASVDENFINGSWSGGFDTGEMPARAWLLLEHLEQWHRWAREEDNPFHGLVDTTRIGLVGHSRGGEAVAMAAAFNRLPYYPDDADVAFDYGFDIQSVVAIAPTDRRYERRLAPEAASYLVLHGSYDSDEASFEGVRVYQRAGLGEDDFKAAVFIHGANHGQFNTGWGRRDYGLPRGWLLNTAPIMPAEEQRQAAKVFVAGFLDATLRGRDRYRAIFRDHRAAREWLPETLFVTRYRDTNVRHLATYQEDLDLTTGTADGVTADGGSLREWREQELEFRDGDPQANDAVVLAWGRADTVAADSAGAGGGARARRSAGTPTAYELRLDPDTLPGGVPDSAGELLFSLASMEPDLPAGDTAGAAASGADTVSGAGGSEVPPVGGGRVDLTVELVDGDGTRVGIPLSEYRPVPPRVEIRLLKTMELTRQRMPRRSEPLLQSYRLPLADFADEAPGFDPTSLSRVRFVFDRTPSGSVALDDVGLAGGASSPVEPGGTVVRSDWR